MLFTGRRSASMYVAVCLYMLILCFPSRAQSVRMSCAYQHLCVCVSEVQPQKLLPGNGTNGRLQDSQIFQAFLAQSSMQLNSNCIRIKSSQCLCLPKFKISQNVLAMKSTFLTIDQTLCRKRIVMPLKKPG